MGRSSWIQQRILGRSTVYHHNYSCSHGAESEGGPVWNLFQDTGLLSSQFFARRRFRLPKYHQCIDKNQDKSNYDDTSNVPNSNKTSLLSPQNNTFQHLSDKTLPAENSDWWLFHHRMVSFPNFRISVLVFLCYQVHKAVSHILLYLSMCPVYFYSTLRHRFAFLLHSERLLKLLPDLHFNNKPVSLFQYQNTI